MESAESIGDVSHEQVTILKGKQGSAHHLLMTRMHYPQPPADARAILLINMTRGGGARVYLAYDSWGCCDLARHGRELEHVCCLIKVLVDVGDVYNHRSGSVALPLEVVLEQPRQL